MRTVLDNLRRPAPLMIWLSGLLAAVFLANTIVSLMMDRRDGGLLTLVVLADVVLAFVFYPFGVMQFVFASIVGDPFPGVFRGVMLLGLVVAARRFLDLALLGKPMRNVMTAPAVWATLFVLSQAMSLVNARDIQVSMEGVRVYVQVLVIFFLIADFVRTERELRWMMLVFMTAGVINFVVALYETQLGVERSGGMVGNANSFGMMQLLLLCLVSPLLMSARAMWQRFLLAAWILTTAIGIVLSGSRAVFVSSVAAAGFFLFFTRGVALRSRVIFASAIPALIAAGLWLAPAGFIDRVGMIPMTMEQADSADSSVAIRLLYARSGIQMGLDNPWTGVGTRQFNEHLPLYAPLQSYRASGTHNMYIAVFAESGFPGLVVFLGLLISVTLTVRSRQVGHRVSSLVGATGVAIELALAAVIVAGPFSSTLQYSKAAWILMALGVVVRRMSREQTEQARVSGA